MCLELVCLAPAANFRFSAVGAEAKTDWLQCFGAAFRNEHMGLFCKQEAPKLTQNDESSILYRQKCQVSLDTCQLSPDGTTFMERGCAGSLQLASRPKMS